LAHESPTARSKRRADGELFFARRGARQEQIGHIAASDEQKQSHGGQDDEKRGAKAANDQIREGVNLDGEMFGVVLWIDGGQMLGNDREIRLRLAFGDSGLQMAKHKPVAIESEMWSGIGVAGLFRNPEVGIAPGKTRRHNADERAGRIVQDEGLVEDGGVGVEAVDPSLVAQDEHGGRARFIVRGLDHAADERGHAQKFKGAWRHIPAAEAIRSFAIGVEHVSAAIRDDPVKDVILLDEVQILGAGVSAAPPRSILFRVVDLNGNEVLRVRVGEGLHENILDNAEDGGRRADAQRKSDHRHNGKAGAFP
jgi:hypothetical protein